MTCDNDEDVMINDNMLVGVIVGLKNWIRFSLAVDPSDLKEGLSRIKAFGLRHAKLS